MAILFYSSVDDMDAWRKDFERVLPGERIYFPDEYESAEDIEYAAMWDPPDGLLASLPNLRVVFSLGAGVDHLFKDKNFPKHIPVVRVVDPGMTHQMSEYVLLQVMLHHRRMAEYAALQRRREWNLLPTQPVAQTRVGVMGLGILGMDAAQRLRDFGFDVAGWSRSPKSAEGITCFSGAGEWDAFLGRSEILICLLPLTEETRGILSMQTFKKLARPSEGMRGPVLINPGRGGHQCEADILEALDKGILGGASLDVFGEEPLPEGHAFWGREDIVVTPHAAAATNPVFVAESIRDNLARLSRGEEMTPLADAGRGY